MKNKNSGNIRLKEERESFRITWKRDPYHMLKNESDDLTKARIKEQY